MHCFKLIFRLRVICKIIPFVLGKAVIQRLPMSSESLIECQSILIFSAKSYCCHLGDSKIFLNARQRERSFRVSSWRLKIKRYSCFTRYSFAHHISDRICVWFWWRRQSEINVFNSRSSSNFTSNFTYLNVFSMIGCLWWGISVESPIEDWPNDVASDRVGKTRVASLTSYFDCGKDDSLIAMHSTRCPLCNWFIFHTFKYKLKWRMP